VAKAIDGFWKPAAILHEAAELLPGLRAMGLDGGCTAISFFGQRPVTGAALQISFLHEIEGGFFD
jgi:hypothetical protein